jgi:hypothetical protein
VEIRDWRLGIREIQVIENCNMYLSVFPNPNNPNNPSQKS